MDNPLEQVKALPIADAPSAAQDLGSAAMARPVWIPESVSEWAFASVSGLSSELEKVSDLESDLAKALAKELVSASAALVSELGSAAGAKALAMALRTETGLVWASGLPK